MRAASTTTRPTTRNWDRLAFRNNGKYKLFGGGANVAQYDFSASGGDAKTRFYLSGTFNDQKGIIIGNRFRRGSLRLNLDHSITDNLKRGHQRLAGPHLQRPGIGR